MRDSRHGWFVESFISSVYKSDVEYNVPQWVGVVRVNGARVMIEATVQVNRRCTVFCGVRYDVTLVDALSNCPGCRTLLHGMTSHWFVHWATQVAL